MEGQRHCLYCSQDQSKCLPLSGCHHFILRWCLTLGWWQLRSSCGWLILPFCVPQCFCLRWCLNLTWWRLRCSCWWLNLGQYGFLHSLFLAYQQCHQAVEPSSPLPSWNFWPLNLPQQHQASGILAQASHLNQPDLSLLIQLHFVLLLHKLITVLPACRHLHDHVR